MLLIIVFWCPLAVATPAWAHAELVGSTPANGSRLATAPSEIRLRFSERVNAVRDGLKVLDSSGGVRAQGTPGAAANSGVEVVLPLAPSLPDGVYTVVWRVVSADSHPIHGAFVFSVGDALVTSVPEGGARTDVDRRLAAVFWAFRWLGYAGLALLAGGAAFLALCWPAGWASRPARRIVFAGWLTSVVCACATLVLQGPYGQGGTLAGVADTELMLATLRSGYGAFIIARLGLLAAAGVLALGLAQPRTMWGFLRPWHACAVSVMLIATWAGTGHAAAGNLVTKAVDTLHLTAMSVWLGGLAVLWAALLVRPAEPSAAAASAVTRFSSLAMACVATLALSGVYQAWRNVGSIAALAGSAYGRLLLFKVVGIALLLWLGSLSYSAVRRGYAIPGAVPLRGRAARDAALRERQARVELRRSVGLETATAVVVLGLTSVLVSTPPGSRPLTPAAGTTIAADEVAETELPLPGGGSVSVALDPARVGANQLKVTVHNQAGADWDVPELSASLTLPASGIGPLPVSLDRRQPGRYVSSSLSLPAPGGWQLRISVRTSDIDQHTVQTEVSVTPARIS